MSATKPKSRKRFGCLTVLAILVALLLLGAAAFWYFVLERGPSKGGRMIISGPVDPEASLLVQQKLIESGLTGVKAAVFPLPGGKAAPLLPEPPLPDDDSAASLAPPPVLTDVPDPGNGVMLVLDPANGFMPAAGEAAKRQQALDAIKNIVAVNRANDMDIRRVGLEYQEDGEAIIALTVSMEAMIAAADGLTNDDAFLAEVDVELKDYDYLVGLFR